MKPPDWMTITEPDEFGNAKVAIEIPGEHLWGTAGRDEMSPRPDDRCHHCELTYEQAGIAWHVVDPELEPRTA